MRSPDHHQSRCPLWASAKVPGLLESEKQKAIITELLGKQQADGGWSCRHCLGPGNEMMAPRKK